MGELSKSQVDKLGERLRQGASEGASEGDDLRLLEEYRRSFLPAFVEVMKTLRGHALEPLERPAKSTPSIIAKLKRGSIRLSRIQDIAGCRILVRNRLDQDDMVQMLRSDFAAPLIKDRRDKPNNGYRAVHVIPCVGGQHVEIQVRTALQHLWAVVSEKAFDVLDPAIKYGGGPEALQEFLLKWSGEVAEFEMMEAAHLQQLATARDPIVGQETWQRQSGEISRRRDVIIKTLTNMLSSLEAMKRLKEPEP